MKVYEIPNHKSQVSNELLQEKMKTYILSGFNLDSNPKKAKTMANSNV